MCYSTEEEGCFEPGTVDCEEECCTDTYGQGCVAITLAPNCQSVTFTLDPNCLPDLPGCTVDYIEWFAEVHIENSPMVIGNLTFTWNIDLLDLPITEAHYLVGYATVHLTDGTVCRIADQLLIGPGTNNCAGLIGDGEQNKSSKDSGDMVDSNLESLIHPNPVLKGSSIQLSHLNLLDARKLEVINMSGVVLLESDANRSELNIPEDFTSGIYYLKVLTNGESRIYKFLVE